MRRVKEELERVKERGERELPVHLAEDTAFHQLLHSVGPFLSKYGRG